jgi:hypothetical protein
MQIQSAALGPSMLRDRRSTLHALGLTALSAIFTLGAPGCRAEAKPAPASVDPAPARGARRDDGAALRAIAAKRASLREALDRTEDEASRIARQRESARYLERALVDVVLPRWDGTPWSFHGTSTTPGAGTIACGYFVSTTLEEAGLRVERARLAQQPAEAIIKTLVPPDAIARFSDVPIEKFVTAVTTRGEGLYVVGLDNHVGFLIVKAGDVLFHHASYVPPAKVVRERAADARPLVDSRYRVVGKLFTDASLAAAWLDGAAIPTKVPRKAP